MFGYYGSNPNRLGQWVTIVRKLGDRHLLVRFTTDNRMTIVHENDITDYGYGEEML